MFRFRYLILVLVLVVALQFFPSCFRFRMSNKKIHKAFENEPLDPQVKQYDFDGRTINYLEVAKDSTLPMVVFVHGAPGSLKDFLSFMKDSSLTAKARLISVDRPGYGYSDFGKVETSIQKQAALLKPLLEMNQSKQAPILVGHSYGGPVIARVAMDYPELVGALVMAAPAVDPENERIFWVSYPADWPPFRWLLPSVVRVTNDEKLSHVEELEKMLPHWSQIQAPTTFIHGHKDKLVPIANSEFGERMITNAPVDTVFVEKLNHLIPWKRPDLIKKAILKYLSDS